jgi:nucleotide-binding universal stress UspA family protein
MFKRILMAFKFGSACEFALSKCVELAQTHDAELHIFHALDYRLKELDENDSKLLQITKDTNQRFEKELKPLLGDFRDVTFKCMPADEALDVCRQAMKINADLIILGCHQLSDRASMGRVDYVGSTILEKAPCPIMLIPYSEKECR